MFESRMEEYLSNDCRYFFSVYRGECLGKEVHFLNNQIIKILQIKKSYSD